MASTSENTTLWYLIPEVDDDSNSVASPSTRAIVTFFLVLLGICVAFIAGLVWIKYLRRKHARKHPEDLEENLGDNIPESDGSKIEEVGGGGDFDNGKPLNVKTVFERWATVGAEKREKKDMVIGSPYDFRYGGAGNVELSAVTVRSVLGGKVSKQGGVSGNGESVS